MTRDRTPAQLYALLFGIVLLAVGILGFIADSSFGTGSDVDGSDFIVFERAYALGFGSVYLAVTIWGFITGDQVLWLIPVDTADNFLHLAIAATGLAAGLSSRDDTAPSVRPRRA